MMTMNCTMTSRRRRIKWGHLCIYALDVCRIDVIYRFGNLKVETGSSESNSAALTLSEIVLRENCILQFRTEAYSEIYRLIAKSC